MDLSCGCIWDIVEGGVRRERLFMVLCFREREMLLLVCIMEDKWGGIKVFGDGGCGFVVMLYWKGW